MRLWETNMDMIPHDSDVLLMLKVQRDDDKKAFTELYLKFKTRLNRYFLHKLSKAGQDKALSEDYTQEVFLRLWKNRAKYNPDCNLSGYLFTIAKNYWINEQKRIHRLPQTISSEEIPEDMVEKYLVSKDEIGYKLFLRELSNQIKLIAGSLSERQKMVFILNHYEGMSHKEIASIIGCNVNVVGSLKQKAERNIRKKLETHLMDKI